MLCRRTLAVAALLGSAAALAPTRASACGGTAPAEYTITAISPAPGAAGVPRDAGILVHAVPSREAAFETLDIAVTLTDLETGSVVAGRSIEWTSEDGSAAWHPDEPLLPGREYRVEVVPADRDGTPVEGGIPMSSRFVTSSSLLEPLTFSGQIRVAVEAYEAKVQQCDIHPCSLVASGCVDVGTRRALRARLELPAALGGQPDAGQYRARLYFNDDKSPDVTQPDLEDRIDNEEFRIGLVDYLLPAAGEAVPFEQELFREDFDYAPCFTYVVWDPAGHKIQASHCLPLLTQADYAAAIASDAPASDPSGIEGDAVAAAADDDAVTAAADDDAVLSGVAGNPYDAPSGRSGCVLGTSPGAPGGVLVALAALLGGLARRRARHAPPARPS